MEMLANMPYTTSYCKQQTGTPNYKNKFSQYNAKLLFLQDEVINGLLSNISIADIKTIETISKLKKIEL